MGGLARIPTHSGDGASVAFPLGSCIPSQWIYFYRAVVLHRSMEAPASGFMGDYSGCLEIICLLRDLSPASGAQWLLSIQSTATAFILRGHFRHGTALDVDRDRDVPGGG